MQSAESKDPFNYLEQDTDVGIFKSNSFGTGPQEVFANTKYYEPDKLNARHREMVRLTILGYKNIQIASILGVSQSNVCIILNSPLAKELIDNFKDARDGSAKDVQRRFEEIAPMATETVFDIMTGDGETSTNKLKAATLVLEVAGHRNKENKREDEQTLDKDTIAEIKERVRNYKEIEQVTEADFIEESDEPN